MKPSLLLLLLLAALLPTGGCVLWKLTSDRTLAVLPIFDSFQEVVSFGQRLYLACSYGGLLIVDVSDPYGPNPVNTVSDWDSPYSYRWNCTVSGDDLLAAGRSDDMLLRVYAVSDLLTLSSPVPVATLTVPNECLDWSFPVLLDGGFLYLLFPCALTILDVSNPAAPAHLTSSYTPLYSYGSRSLAVRGTSLYLLYEYTVGEGIVTVVDITDRNAPLGMAIIDQIGYPAAVSGRYLLSQFGRSLQVNDLSDPFEPERVDTLSVRTRQAELICADGDYAFLLGAEMGLAVVLIAPYK